MRRILLLTLFALFGWVPEAFAALGIEIKVDRTIVEPGGTVTATIIIRNKGTDSVTGSLVNRVFVSTAGGVSITSVTNSQVGTCQNRGTSLGSSVHDCTTGNETITILAGDIVVTTVVISVPSTAPAGTAITVGSTVFFQNTAIGISKTVKVGAAPVLSLKLERESLLIEQKGDSFEFEETVVLDNIGTESTEGPITIVVGVLPPLVAGALPPPEGSPVASSVKPLLDPTKRTWTFTEGDSTRLPTITVTESIAPDATPLRFVLLIRCVSQRGRWRVLSQATGGGSPEAFATPDDVFVSARVADALENQTPANNNGRKR